MKLKSLGIGEGLGRGTEGAALTSEPAATSVLAVRRPKRTSDRRPLLSTGTVPPRRAHGPCLSVSCVQSVVASSRATCVLESCV